jgi:hypothetical protein
VTVVAQLFVQESINKQEMATVPSVGASYQNSSKGTRKGTSTLQKNMYSNKGIRDGIIKLQMLQPDYVISYTFVAAVEC